MERASAVGVRTVLEQKLDKLQWHGEREKRKRGHVLATLPSLSAATLSAAGAAIAGLG